MSRIQNFGAVSRRALLQAGAGLAGGAILPSAFSLPAFAVGDNPPIGTWPAGSQGDTVIIGAAVPRTGTYAVQGEDELKGWSWRSSTSTPATADQEDRAEGHEGRARQGGEVWSPPIRAAKPNQAVQAQQRFINREQDCC